MNLGHSLGVLCRELFLSSVETLTSSHELTCMKDKVSLALSGSGFKFPAYLGALKALEEQKIEIVELAGVSGGAIVAGLYACGKSIDHLAMSMFTKNWVPLYRFNPINMFRHGGLVTGNEIYEYLKLETEGKTFKEVEIPLYIIATSLTTGEEVVFCKETTPDLEIALAIRASISIPAIFCPVRIGDELYVDGVVMNSMPLNYFTKTDSTHMGIKLQHTGTPKGSPAVLKDFPESIKLSFNIVEQSLFLMIDKHDQWILDTKYHNKVVVVDTQYADPLDSKLFRSTRIRLYKDCRRETLKFIEAKRKACE